MINNKFFKTSVGILCIIGGCFTIFILGTSILRGDRLTPEDCKGPPHNYWVPTPEDIRYQDSMYNIIISTQEQLSTIHTGIDNIIWKLERLEYHDGNWDSIRYEQGGPIDRRRNPEKFYDEDIDMNCGDTLDVRATMYHPIEAQCDSDPLITADGSIIDPHCVSEWNWIAVSRDLLKSGGGCFNYGDSVYVIAGHKTGWYIIHDTMNKRKRMQIDFLESIGTQVYRYTETKLIVNV